MRLEAAAFTISHTLHMFSFFNDSHYKTKAKQVKM